MVQTERLSPDAAGWEICPIFAHQNAAKQTVRRPQKSEEKALKPSGFKAFSVAGAEGLEPSARGFGVAVEKRQYIEKTTQRRRFLGNAVAAFMLLMLF